jgi:hypothetical protein
VEASGKLAKRFEAFQAGGGGLIAKTPVIRQQARCHWKSDELLVTFTRPGSFIEATVEALGLPADWQEFGTLNLNATGRVQIVVLGARCRLESRTGKVDLTDLPLAAGIQPLFKPTGIRIIAFRRGTVRIRSLRLIPGRKTLKVVDRFGQRIHATWPGKIKRVADLRIREELPAPPAHRDEFGGWTRGSKFPASGFFRTAQDGNGRWWLVTPTGHPFWSIGTTCVRTTEVTPVSERSFLFEMPTENFYLANVLRKWGTLERWRDHTLARFQCWGFNTIGSFTGQSLMLDQKVVPHTRILRTRGGAPDLRPSFANVLDPKWEKWLDELFAAEVAPQRNNPWLVGWFVDNEAAWRTWGAKGGRYAEKYFSTISRLLKKHDPNHLYLGCRFVRMPPHESIVRMAGRYVDVLSVNCYALWPDRDAFTNWHKMSGGRPILLGEHHLAQWGPRQLPALYRCFTPAERHRYYQKFVREWARLPFSVGCHWFQYTDQPLTGRASNGENQIIGFVDITDQPHQELVKAAHAATSKIYRQHATG